MPRPLPLRVLARGLLRGPARDGAPRWRSTAAMFTSMTALAATSLGPGHALAEPLASPCALTRTAAHHSEGADTWNTAYVRPTRPLDAVMVFLSFPDSTPHTTPAELTGDYFPATSRFFEQASYGKFTVRPHPRRAWIQMPHASTSYAIQRDWNAGDRAAYLRDALAVADPRVDFSRYDVVYFIADPDAPGVDSDATKVVNLDTPLRADGKDIRRVVTVFEKHPPDRLVLAHETGHVFDLPDLYHRPTDGKGDWDTYVGDWDLMGSQFGLAPDLFGWHKWRLGWLEPHQVACVLGSGTTRLTLEPLEAGPAHSTVGSAGASAREAAGAGVLATGPAASTASGAAASSGASGKAGTSGAGVAWQGPRVPSGGLRTSVRGPGAAPGASADAVGVAAPPGSRTVGVGRGTKLAVVPTGPDSAIAFEARGPAGNDRSTCERGVLVYRVRSRTESGSGPIQVLDAHPGSESCWEDSVYPPLADAPVRLGESFEVPGANVRVQVEDRSASGAWTVRITTG
ncbi:M6 family metalloprotease domain-containing protein [Streptomyces sp. NBC_00328]|uniref:M6 family metalloprotease domain-containing protein n=1 Tax=Streptomyces sp. NBC_00328 TaxID=2903646 RepID=UPI002E2D856B|nr:M6 family metalloprotease domain-containing protein [Streptomyces sp. NBC_00328]